MWKVYVGNLDSRVKERELADEFRIYGNVRSVWVARNPPGYAFVEFDDRRDAEDAVSRLDGKHGWRVEMSRKSVGGGHSRSSHGSESRCYDCGGVGHFARECRSRVSRHSQRRSPSPPSRSDSHRHGLTRSGRGSSRSPRRDRRNTYGERSSPRRKRERSRSLESDKSDSRGHRGKECRHGTSPQHEKPGSSSPYIEEEEEGLDKSPHSGALENEHEEGRSPQNGDSETRGVNSQEGSQGSKSPPSERSEDVGDIQKEEYIHSGSPQREQSDTEGSRSPDVREDSRSPLPENINSFEDGESPLNRDSPLTNGNSGRSPEEENDGSHADRSPAEEIAEGHHSGESD